MTTERTWKITDADGGNRRTVTLAQFRAEINARHQANAPIAKAWHKGDMAGVAAAQKANKFRRQH